MDIFPASQPFDFGRATYQKGGRYGPVKQPYLNLAYLSLGTAVVIGDGVTRTAQAGVAHFTYTEETLEVVYPAGGTQSVTWCHTGQVAAPAEYRALLRAVPRGLSPSPLLLTLLEEGFRLANDNSSGGKRVRHTLGAAAFNEYFRLARLDEEARELPVAVLRAKRYLDEHFTEVCDLKRLSAIALLSPNYLLELFKEHIGTTPTKYMWKLRLTKGVQLLLQTGLPVGSIAYECGFRDQHHFARTVKQFYGSSPSGLRDREWMRDPAQFGRDVPDLVF